MTASICDNFSQMTGKYNAKIEHILPEDLDVLFKVWAEIEK